MKQNTKKLAISALLITADVVLTRLLAINTPVMMENFESWRSVKDFCADQNYKFSSNASLTTDSASLTVHTETNISCR